MKLSKKAQEKIIGIIDVYSERIRFEEALRQTAIDSNSKADWDAYWKYCERNKKFIDEMKEFLGEEL